MGLAAFLPSAATRLSFPLGYWNGLAVFVAFYAVPLLLRLAIVAQSFLVRGVAIASIPALAATIYLQASSRGGVATALTGTAVFLALTARRWAAVAALVVATVGALGAVSILLPRTQLVNGPLEGELAGEPTGVDGRGPHRPCVHRDGRRLGRHVCSPRSAQLIILGGSASLLLRPWRSLSWRDSLLPMPSNASTS